MYIAAYMCQQSLPANPLVYRRVPSLRITWTRTEGLPENVHKMTETRTMTLPEAWEPVACQ